MCGKSKGFVVLVLLVTFVSLIVAGCGGNDKKPAASEQQVIKLKMAHLHPPTAYLHTYGYEPFAKLISEKTNGKVKIEIYPAETLGKAADMYDMVKSGICDIAGVMLAAVPNRFPLTEVMYLPMLGIETSAQGTKVVWDLYNNNAAVKKEYDGVHMLFNYTTDGFHIATKKPFSKLEDLDGMKFRAPGGPVLSFFQSMGATPVSIPISNVYQSMEKGIITGFCTPWEALDNTNSQEVSKYVTEANISQTTFFLVMNQKTWDSLPPDVQKVFNEVGGLNGGLLFSTAFDKTRQPIVDKFKKAGVTITKLAPEEYARWVEKAKPMQDKWVSDMQAKGLPGKQVLEDTIKLIEKHKEKK